MNANNLLEVTCQEILGVINPSSADCTVRLQIIDQLQAIISAVESLRGATVEPFGSFLSHLFTRWGDLDISIELSNGLHIVSPGKKHKQTLLVDVLKALKETGVRRIQLIPNAKVPILKLTSHQNISCDISISNLAGQMKSKFLLWISVIDSRFRNMVLLAKEWAKAHNINNPKVGTLNSYSLCLLVIFHFQTCEPAIFPPLKEIYPTNMAEELRGVRSDVEQHFEAVCAANINKFKNTRRINRSSLSELFTSFLAKFSDINIRAKDQGICTFSGTWEDIGTNMRWLPKTYALLIEDPLEQPQNCARTVAGGQLTRISEVFYSSYELLTFPNQTRNSLFRCMLRPQISRSLLPNYMPATNPTPRPFAPPQLRNIAAAGAVGRPNGTRSHMHGQESHKKAQPVGPQSGGKGKGSYSGQQGGVGANGINKRAASQGQGQGQGGMGSYSGQPGGVGANGINKRGDSQGQGAHQVWRPKNVSLNVGIGIKEA